MQGFLRGLILCFFGEWQERRRSRLQAAMQQQQERVQALLDRSAAQGFQPADPTFVSDLEWDAYLVSDVELL